MKSYPTVNWWRNNLRMHESTISFVARFAWLNRIKITESNFFLRGPLESNFIATSEVISSLAETLDENPEVLKTVLNEPIRLPEGNENHYTRRSDRGSLRFCEDCASIGYHSYLHEYDWLALCPFHGSALKIEEPKRNTSGRLVRKCETLVSLMQSRCKQWPTSTAGFDPEDYQPFVWLSSWLPRVIGISRKYSENKVWKSFEQPVPDSKTPGQVIGRLHAFEPISKEFKRLFSDVEEGWSADIQHFPHEALQELQEVAGEQIHTLFILFKRIVAYTDQPYRYVNEMRSCLSALAAGHPECKCNWGSEETRYGQRWIRVHPDDWPHWALLCPYKYVSKEIDLAVGKRFEQLSYRRQDLEKTSLISESRNLVERGLVGLTPDACTSPEGHLYMYPQHWPPLEWIGRPWLNAIFDAAALSEFRALFESYSALLRQMQEGENPGNFMSPPVLLWLAKTEEGLVLIRWYKRHANDPGRCAPKDQSRYFC